MGKGLQKKSSVMNTKAMISQPGFLQNENIFKRLYVFEQFYVHSKTERKVMQNVPISLLPPHVHSLPHYQHPFPFTYSTRIQTITQSWEELRM